jgi:Spy/CpxP family protein refolding chaperone
MKRSLALLSATAVFAAGLTLSPAYAADEAAAQAPDEVAGRPGHFGRAFVRELDLTVDQRVALKGVLRMHRPLLRPLREQAQAEREALRALVVAPSLDENALAAQADRIAATHKQIVIASAHMRADLRKILSAEQLAKLETMREHGRARMQNGRARFRERFIEP